MHYVVIVGSGVVATFFGPFDTKADVEAWARETENKQYVTVVMYPPYLGGRKP